MNKNQIIAALQKRKVEFDPNASIEVLDKVLCRSWLTAEEIAKIQADHAAYFTWTAAQLDTLNGRGLPQGPCQCEVCKPNAELSGASRRATVSAIGSGHDKLK